MGSLIGLKNVIMFSAVLLTIGSLSAQQAFAGGPTCASAGDGNWNDKDSWTNCDGSTPDKDNDVDIIGGNNTVITGVEAARELNVIEGSTLFIDCDASLDLFSPGQLAGNSNITNHGILSSVENFTINGFLFNSGDLSNVVEGTGNIVQISTKCTQPIGGTVGSMDTVSLLVAGAQGNMGLWIIALVGVLAGVGIVYKAKSNKTNKETL